MKKRIAWSLCAVTLVFVLAACGGSPTLSPDKTAVERGGTVTVKWTAPGSYAKSAWIGLIPSQIAHGNEATNDEHDVTYMYLNGKSSGSFLFTMPNKKGSWDLRMNDTDSNGKEVASVTIQVQ